MRAGDPQPADVALHHFDDDDAVGHLLARDLGEDGAVAFGGVERGQRLAGFFDVGRRPVRAEKWIERVIDGFFGKNRIAFDSIFIDFETGGARRNGSETDHN